MSGDNLLACPIEGLPIDLSDIVSDVRISIEESRRSGLDLSREYCDETTPGYKLQEKMRVNTRSLLCRVQDYATWNMSIRENGAAEILKAFDQVRDIFGTHNFHHVMEGRLAETAQILVRLGVRVHEEFIKYVEFKIMPHNTPGLNYNTRKDLMERPELIPPAG